MADLADFWGGYSVEFKLIELDRYEELKENIEALRKNALQLGQGARPFRQVEDRIAETDQGFRVLVFAGDSPQCLETRHGRKHADGVSLRQPGSVTIKREILGCQLLLCRGGSKHGFFRHQKMERQ